MSRKAAGGLAAITVTLAASVPASAGQASTVAPTRAERAAILAAWAGGAKLSRAHAACLTVRLAASNHGYGTVRFRLTRTCEQRWGFNGVNIIKRGKEDQWEVAFEGSAFRCPLPRIPRQVQRDLGICR